MFVSAIAAARFGMSMTLGRPFHRRSLDRLLDGMRAAQREFGTVTAAEDDDLLGGAALDPETRRLVQGRRLRTQAVRAARETDFYAEVFRRSGIDPAGVDHDSVSAIPVTSKQALRDDPSGFVRKGASPAHGCSTTGTTGRATTVWLSDDELHLMATLAALAHFQSRTFRPQDQILLGISPRNRIAAHATAFAAAAVGAVVRIGGMVAPEQTLATLAEHHPIPGHTSRISVLTAHPSYLALLVETARGLGYGPADFGLERVLVGGEILTPGLRRRAQEVFGELEFDENYALTELVPFGGIRCERGHVHYEPTTCLVEVLDLHGRCLPVADGEPGVLVGTPLPPFRDTTLLLRYDTEDVVQTLAHPPDCTMSRLPALAQLLGKRRQAVGHDDGWTFVRPVVEALESVDGVPLPARFGFWRTRGGVAVEVMAPDSPGLRTEVGVALERHGVPLAELRVVQSQDELLHPLPLRCDLREGDFARAAPTVASAVTAVTASEMSAVAGRRGRP
ncbi:AMP-binding protein [Streptomyces sp. NPDC059037]|uniref:AMP-binding protein n=1 Tax=Streptomyces sp. NPDC059037 TaxID=3346710 RepID=UPI0036CA6D15